MSIDVRCLVIRKLRRDEKGRTGGRWDGPAWCLSSEGRVLLVGSYEVLVECFPGARVDRGPDGKQPEIELGSCTVCAVQHE